MRVDPPGQVRENFVHRADEMLMVKEGKLELEMAGEIFPLAPGKEVFIPKKMVHSVRDTGGTVSRWLYGYKKDPAW